MSRAAYWFAIAWTVAVTVFLVFKPMYGTKTTWMETTADGRQIQVSDSGHSTLLDVNGPRVLILLAIPLLLVALPRVAKNPDRRRQIGVACAITMFALAFLGSASIGLFYYPTAIALLLAAATTRPAAATAQTE